MAKHFVLVAGNIGSGKTSLTERLGERLDWDTAYESVVDNPYLADFYADMAVWAFHLNVFFLGHRADQHLALADSPASTIIDYRKVFDLIVGKLPSPDLLIHLKAPVSVLMGRIQQRARDMELGITQEYLELLDSLYVDWINRFDICPVLTIRTDDLDFVHQPRHLDIVINRIHDKLTGKEELQFPDD